MPTVFDELRVLLLKTQAFFDALVVGLSPSVPGSGVIQYQMMDEYRRACSLINLAFLSCLYSTARRFG
jgi:hypothetical protein